VPQSHLPGAEAEVEFGEFYVLLKGVKTKCYLFDYRLSASRRSVHRVYSTQAQEAFLEGHIDAFEELGGIPTMQIKYDNLSAAVRAVVYGGRRQRVENDRWVLFRSHYGFDPSTASRVSAVRTRRAGSREMWAGLGAPGFPRCPRWTRSQS
jgi:transposase